MENRNPGEHGDVPAGQVHAHISQPYKGAQTSGRYGGTPGTESGSAGTADGGEELVGQARERATEMLDDARDVVGRVRDKADDLRNRAGEMAGQVKDRATRAKERAEEELEERGVFSLVRGNPLPAVGVAFALGYLLAGSNEKGRGRVMNLATGQLRAAIVAGIAAAVSRELRDTLAEQGGTLGAIFGGDEQSGGRRASATTTGSDFSGGTAY